MRILQTLHPRNFQPYISYRCIHSHARTPFTCMKQACVRNKLRCSRVIEWKFLRIEWIPTCYSICTDQLNKCHNTCSWLTHPTLHPPPNGSVLLITPQTYVPTVFENYTACLELEEQRVELSLWDTSGNWSPFLWLWCRFNGLLLPSCTEVRGCAVSGTRVCRSWLKRENPPGWFWSHESP